MAAAFKLLSPEEDQACPPTDETPLPVPPWVLRLANRRLRDDVRVGPALINLLAYVVGLANQRSTESVDTSMAALMAAFPHNSERTIKGWIEDLRAPVDDDQTRQTKYLRLGLLECNKAELRGEFRLTPLRPASDGPLPAVTKAGAQQRLWTGESSETEPRDFAQSPAAEEPPRDCAQSPALLDRLLAELKRRAGGDQFAEWFDLPTRWTVAGSTVAGWFPHRCYWPGVKRLYRTAIEPACRDVFPHGGAFEVHFAAPTEPENDGGKDRPRDFAQSPAVPFKVYKFSSLGTLSEYQENELEVQACAPRVFAAAEAIAGRFAAPAHFYRWQWVQTGWAMATGKLPEELLDKLVKFCHEQRQPHWQFAKSIAGTFQRAGLRWLDPRKADERPQLLSRLAAAGVKWRAEWEGPPRKPR